MVVLTNTPSTPLACSFLYLSMDSLCALVPVTSKGRSSPSHCLEGLRLLGASLSSGATDGAPTPALSVVLGLDSDDPLVDLAEEACNCFLPGVQTAVRVFGGGELAAQRRQCDGAAPICWMWNELALEARSAFQPLPQWMVLLGEDTRMQPAGWPALLARQVEAAGPALRCVALLDAADPGFPSFPVMHASHLQLFGMVPREFVNQGGDPLLYALYRSIGAAAVCPTVTVHNTVGEFGQQRDAQVVSRHAWECAVGAYWSPAAGAVAKDQ
jgi:hypothetical protein